MCKRSAGALVQVSSKDHKPIGNKRKLIQARDQLVLGHEPPPSDLLLLMDDRSVPHHLVAARPPVDLACTGPREIGEDQLRKGATIVGAAKVVEEVVNGARTIAFA